MLSQLIGRSVGSLRDGLARGLARMGVGPDFLTVLGCGMTVVAGVLIGLGELAPGGMVLLLAGACDMLDGAVARIGRRTTPFGAFLDSSLDRVSDLAVLGGLAVHFARLGNLTYTLLSVLALGAAEIISYTRARAECLIRSCRVGFWERGERTVLLILALVGRRELACLWVLATLPWLTVLHRILHTREALREAGGEEDVRSSRPCRRLKSATGRVLFFNPPRGSLPYDLVALVVLAGVFLVPLRLSDPLRGKIKSLSPSQPTASAPAHPAG